MCFSSLELKFRERSKFIQLMEFGLQDRILDIGNVLYLFQYPQLNSTLYTILFKVVEEDFFWMGSPKRWNKVRDPHLLLWPIIIVF